MNMQDVIYAILLGVVQGTSEFLPISSSGHLVVFSAIWQDKPLPLTLNVALHVGTLLAVLVYFWRDWLRLGRGTLAFAFRRERSFESHVLLPGLLIGTIPAGLIGILFEKDIEAIFHNPLSVAAPLAIVGVALWWVDSRSAVRKPLSGISISDALLVGVAQAFALVPGVSRSGATILGGRLLGLGREDAARFSFLLGTPAMAGAAILKSKELADSITEPIFFIGVVVSLVVGCLTIGFLLRFLRANGFAAFALYRCLLAGVILSLFL